MSGASRSDLDSSSSSSLAPSPLRPASAAGTDKEFPPAKIKVAGAPDSAADVAEQKPPKKEVDLIEVDLMKERFAKLLLGEDMSGGGKGVCTALAISNAITNLSATVFGQLWRLEPLAPQKKAMWKREMEWLLCVSDSVVELMPSTQDFPGGGTFEVMVPRPRSDLHINLPALKKLDAMLTGMLDGFSDTEFSYVDRGILVDDLEEDGGSEACPSSSFSRLSPLQEDKWWLPCPRVPSKGLSEDERRRLQQCRDCSNQILKAAMAINNSILADMAIPDAYYETLPKNGKTCLGDIIYQYITADKFSPECLLDCLDMSSEHHILEIANRVEAAVHVWRKKEKKVRTRHRKVNPSWGGKVKGLVNDGEKTQLLAERAEGLLQSLKLWYPNLPQTILDMTKIQHNKDVGQSILESYSRVLESLAFNIIARIDDVLYADDAVKKSGSSESASLFNRPSLQGLPNKKMISPSIFSNHSSPAASPFHSSSASSPLPGSPQKLKQFVVANHTSQNLIGPKLGKTIIVCNRTASALTQTEAVV